MRRAESACKRRVWAHGFFRVFKTSARPLQLFSSSLSHSHIPYFASELHLQWLFSIWMDLRHSFACFELLNLCLCVYCLTWCAESRDLCDMLWQLNSVTSFSVYWSHFCTVTHTSRTSLNIWKSLLTTTKNVVVNDLVCYARWFL